VTTVNQILEDRGKTNGDYNEMSLTIQNLKRVMRESDGYDDLSPQHREALDMIAHKMGRILTGNPHHVDHWQDIQGYAKLGEMHVVK